MPCTMLFESVMHYLQKLQVCDWKFIECSHSNAFNILVSSKKFDYDN
jgi:hypothetical protein